MKHVDPTEFTEVKLESQSFGDFRIDVVDHDVLRLPARIDAQILVPDDVDSLYVRKSEVKQPQIILLRDLPDYSYSMRDSTCIYFGGMDESPFLARLDPHLAFRKKDQSLPHILNAGALDTQLKPDIAHLYEKRTGKKAQRQGDWFFFPLTLGGKQLTVDELFFTATYDPNSPDREIIEDAQLGHTRHVLAEGRAYAERWVDGMPKQYVGEGVLKAPDHADRDAEKAFLFRHMDGLWMPKDSRAEYMARVD